jgi:hypothetical protein
VRSRRAVPKPRTARTACAVDLAARCCSLTPHAQLPLLVNRRRLLERLQTIVGPSVEVDPDVTDFVQVASFSV